MTVFYKGFDSDFKCRGFQFEVGKTYEHEGEVKACQSGFHACETAIDVLGYYDPANSRFAEVRLEGDTDRNNDDSKVCAAKITVVAELSLPEFINKAVAQIVAAAKKTKKATGYQSAATNTGYRSAATNTGDQSAATNTGDQSAATNTGDHSAATASGSHSAATASGESATAVVTGYGSKVMAERDGCSLFANEISLDGKILSNACGITGKQGIKSGVWYQAKNGKLQELSEC